ncbi:unknown [Roseburia inulinivorans CAG:15]|nr:unknown [Roseburia inulinivorans CAG:15]
MTNLTKRSNTYLWANKTEAGTREKMDAYLIVM